MSDHESQSPTSPTGTQEMNFYDALKQVAINKKITRLEWKNKEIYGVLDGGVLKLHKTDGVLYSWLVNDGDLFGEDWIVI